MENKDFSLTDNDPMATAKSVAASAWYGEQDVYGDIVIPLPSGEIPHTHNTVLDFWQTDTVSAIQRLKREGEEDVCALNFASYTHPGGGVLTGAKGQEEDLCRKSNLYFILRAFDWVYQKHERRSNKCLYHNDMLYSPFVIFEGDWIADVITCAAPNAKAFLARYGGRSDAVSAEGSEAYEAAMRERLEAILRVASTRAKDKTLVLGAFGCGAFGNDIHFVSAVYKDLLNNAYLNTFKRIVMACPDERYFPIMQNVIRVGGTSVDEGQRIV